MFKEAETRLLLLQCHTPPREPLLHLFTAVYKRSVEGGLEVFFTLGFLFGLFGVGSF
jgi:hypothetical protein